MITRLLFVVIVLTLAPMQAWAECAYVLWWHGSLYPTEGPRPLIVAPTWHPLETYPTLDNCKRGETVTKKNSPQYTYVCLPDTVHPRGSKGR
jgi:hypothetical protein